MRIDDVLQRIQGEFTEMPGLRLTAAQAQRLWGLERAVCDELLGALKEVKPTIFVAVPRVYEKIHANVVGEIERSSGAKRAIGRWALKVGATCRRMRSLSNTSGVNNNCVP